MHFLIAALLVLELRSKRKAISMNLKNLALKILKNPTVRKTALGLLAAIAAAAGFSHFGG